MDTENPHNNESNVVYKSCTSEIVRRRINDQDTKDVDFIVDFHAERMEVVIKTLTSPHPSHDDVCFLNNEYHILTKYLANCNSSVRRAIGRTVAKPACKEPGQHAIYFEWVEGISLQDLIEQWISGSATDMNSPPIDDILLVRLMREIAFALSEVHKAGVIHNDTAKDNIIVNFNMTADENEDSVSATIIDFGYSSTVAMAETDDTGETVNDDLYNLGVIYRDVLLALYPSASTRSSLSRRSITSIGDAILSDSVPNSLHSVVSSLTYCETDDEPSNPHYKSAMEVVEDLDQMLDDPEIFLYEQHKVKSHTPDLIFKCDKLYGRSQDINRLLKTYKQVCHAKNGSNKDNSASPGMVLVTGYGGSGKTTFVHSLKDTVIKSSGYFVTGKFDVHQSNVPYSALINALSHLCSEILVSNGNTLENTRKNIISSVGSEHTMLTELIPNLSTIIGGSENEASCRNSLDVLMSGSKAQNKLNFAFRRFMRAVATNEHPLVMVLDDLQWADMASLKLIQSFVTDSENRSPILFIGCYRDNEVNEDHPLSTTINEVEKLQLSSNKKIDVIKIDNLCREDVNMMISDALLTKRRVTRNTITKLVYQKTCGSPLFSVQFLKSLVEDGLLFYESESMRWNWNEDNINRKGVSNSVADFLTHKITTRLSENARNTLKLAACIGSIFEVKLLAMVTDASARESRCSDLDQVQEQRRCDSLVVEGGDIQKTLDKLAREGLIEDVGSKVQYRFAHDRIHQAAYQSIPDAERSAIHQQIGELMHQMLNASKSHSDILGDIDSLLFRSTDQLNRGSKLISDESKRISLAELNLRVGEICMKKSAFQTALTHVEAGIRLIDREKSWKEHYDLTLRLHNIATEAKSNTGVFDGIPELLEDIFAHAKSFEDKLNAYSTQILILGSQAKVDDAIKVGLDVLAMMGEKFPTSITKSTVIFEVMKTRRKLKRKKETDLLQLPSMTDKNKIAAMHFLVALLLNLFYSKPLLATLINCRMIRLSVSYGICEASAFSFSCFSYVLCEKLGKTKEATKYGQLALSLLERYDRKEWIAKVNMLVYAGVAYWSENDKSSTENFLLAHKIGMEVGDIEYADMCAVQAVREALFCGESLVLAEERARIFCRQFAEHNQETKLRMCVPAWQTILNLLGKSDDAGELAGEAMNFEAFFNTKQPQANDFFESANFFFEMYVAYMFDRPRVAAEKSEAVKKRLSSASTEFRPRMQYNFLLYDGLISIDMARITQERKWKVEAQRNMRRLKRATKKSPKKHLHMYHLLKAEFAMLRGKKKEAAKKYDVAIADAIRAGFCHHEGLAYEKAGIFFKREGWSDKSAQYFVSAHQCYLKWGAQAKADHLYACWMC